MPSQARPSQLASAVFFSREKIASDGHSMGNVSTSSRDSSEILFIAPSKWGGKSRYSFMLCAAHMSRITVLMWLPENLPRLRLRLSCSSFSSSSLFMRNEIWINFCALLLPNLLVLVPLTRRLFFSISHSSRQKEKKIKTRWAEGEKGWTWCCFPSRYGKALLRPFLRLPPRLEAKPDDEPRRFPETTWMWIKSSFYHRFELNETQNINYANRTWDEDSSARCVRRFTTRLRFSDGWRLDSCHFLWSAHWWVPTDGLEKLSLTSLTSS